MLRWQIQRTRAEKDAAFMEKTHPQDNSRKISMAMLKLPYEPPSELISTLKKKNFPEYRLGVLISY